MPDMRPAEARYPVVFRGPDGLPAAGALTITRSSIRLTGRGRGAGAGAVELTIPSAQIERVRIGHGAAERINGYATVVLDRRDGPSVVIAPYGMHLLHELSDLLAAVTEEPVETGERVDLIVPIKPGCEGRIRRLVAEGPPFDPSGFDEHRVYLGETDVVFTFLGADVQARLRDTLAAPELWRAGLAWRRCIAGRPYAAPQGYAPQHGRELIFSWPFA